MVDEPKWDVARGTCPQCASHDVTHLLIGLTDLTPTELTSDLPDWIEPVGCLHPGYDRTCSDCGHTWDSSSA